jgi:CheY-like chemotaxis protein
LWFQIDRPYVFSGTAFAKEKMKLGYSVLEGCTSRWSDAWVNRSLIESGAATLGEKGGPGMRNREAGGHWKGRDRSLISALDKADSRMTSCKVLLVDDEPSILTVLHWAVQDLGCLVTSAHGGQAALDKLCKETFDILITDLLMPDLDGFFLLKMAKKLAPRMKIIVMTGSPELLPHVLGIGCRLDGLLVKPFGLNKLKRAILKCADGAGWEEEEKAKFTECGMERKDQ